METKHYHYPPSISTTKSLLKFFIFLMILLSVNIWMTAKSSDYKSGFEYIVALLAPSLMALGLFLFIYSWSNIDVDDRGLLIEFLWFKLRVFWEDIVDVRHVGTKSFGVWLLRTSNRLTFVHRLYSVFYTFSIHPGVPIHIQSKIHNELIKEINKHSMK